MTPEAKSGWRTMIFPVKNGVLSLEEAFSNVEKFLTQNYIKDFKIASVNEFHVIIMWYVK